VPPLVHTNMCSHRCAGCLPVSLTQRSVEAVTVCWDLPQAQAQRAQRDRQLTLLRILGGLPGLCHLSCDACLALCILTELNIPPLLSLCRLLLDVCGGDRGSRFRGVRGAFA
jgi:hypothetical protein